MDVKTSPGRMAIFLPKLKGGGAERSMLNVAHGLADLGYCVDLVLADKSGEYLGLVTDKVRLVDLKAPRVMSAIFPLARYLKRERPAALVAALDHANVAALLAAKISGVKTRTSVSIRNTVSEQLKTAGRQQKVEFWLAKRLYPNANAIISVSEGVAEDIKSVMGLDGHNLGVIYNPVVSDEMLEKAKESPAHPWFTDGGDPVVLGAGRLNDQKDFSTLIRAFAKASETHPLRLMIIGEGEKREELTALAGSLGISDRFALPGFVDNPFSYMAKSSVFVLSSKHEGLPGVLIQAMASGTPVVSTDCPSGPKEILASGRYGELVPVGDVDSLAGAISKTLGSPAPPRESWLPFESKNACRRYGEVMLRGFEGDQAHA